MPNISASLSGTNEMAKNEAEFVKEQKQNKSRYNRVEQVYYIFKICAVGK